MQLFVPTFEESYGILVLLIFSRGQFRLLSSHLLRIFLSAKKFITFFKANSTQKTLKGSRNIQFFALIPADLFDIIASFASRSNFFIQIFKMATNFVVATLSFCILSLLKYVHIRLLKTKLSTRWFLLRLKKQKREQFLIYQFTWKNMKFKSEVKLTRTFDYIKVEFKT